MQHVLCKTVTTDDMHATLTQASIAQKIPLNDTRCTKNVLCYICNSRWEQIKFTVYVCASIYIAHNMQSCRFRIIESDALLWLTRHAMPCGKHMKQHDAQLALGRNPLAYRVCIIWEVCCEMAKYCKTARLGHSQNREAWVHSRLLLMKRPTAWVLFFLFQDWADLVAVLKLKVVPFRVILRGHLRLPGYRQHLQLIWSTRPLRAEEEHVQYDPAKGNEIRAEGP